MRARDRIAAVLAASLAVTGACNRAPEGPDVGALISQLKSADPEARGKASLAIIRAGEPAVPGLIEMLNSEDHQFRATAASTLFGLGPKARAAVPALADALSDSDAEMPAAVGMALELIR